MKIFFRIVSILFFWCISSMYLCAESQLDFSEDTLIIKGDRAYPPFEFINEKGEFDGFNVELIRALMEELHLNYKLELDLWDNVVTDLKNGEVDVVTGLMYSREKLLYTYFSMPYCNIYQYAVVRKNSEINSLEDLKGKELIVQKSDREYSYAIDNQLTDKLYSVLDMEDGFRMLHAGLHDAVICSDMQAYYFIRNNPDYKDFSVRYLGVEPQEYCIAVNMNNKDLIPLLNSGLRRLKISGKYSAIYEKWFGIYESENTKVSVVWYISIAILMAIIFVSWLFVWTVKKQVQKAVRKSKLLNLQLKHQYHLLETMYKYLPIGMELYDQNGFLLDINPKNCEIFGVLSKKEVLGVNINDSLHYLEEVKKQILNGEIGEFEFVYDSDGYNYSFTIKSGIHRHVHVRFAPIKNELDIVSGYVILNEDITERVHREELLKSTLLRFNTIFNSINSGIEIYDNNENLIDCNQKKREMFGEDSMLFTKDGTKNPNMNETLRLAIMNANSTTIYLPYDYSKVSFSPKKEGKIMLEVKVSPMIDVEGKKMGVVLLHSDVTENMQLNQKYYDLYNELECILEALPIGVSLYDKDGLQTYINTIANQIFKERMILTHLQKHISIFEDPLLSEDVREKIRKGKNVNVEVEYSMELDKSDKNTSNCLFLDIKSQPIRNEEGEIEKTVLIISDITDRYKRQHELEIAKEQAEQSNKLKSAFLANMSHEIRTPLNAIVGFSDILIHSDNAEEKEEYGQIISMNNEILLNLIGDILDLSKIESGVIEFNRAEFDLAAHFRNLEITFQQKMINDNVRLVAVHPYDSCMVFLDMYRVTQLITNFMTNAIKFTINGEIKMWYEVVEGGVKIGVTDTGIGIAEDKLDKVFERFYKLNDFAQGTGLGMAICKAIVDRIGGFIGVKSQLNVGSTFWVELNTSVLIKEKKIEKENTKENVLTDGNQLCLFEDSIFRKSVLLAEDNESNFKLVYSILKNVVTLELAKNGQEAVELAQKNHYDAILMDMKMPIMDGYEAIREIRKFNKEISIVAVTANAFDSDRKDAISAGCNYFLAKPINKKALLEVLSKCFMKQTE